MNIVGVKIISAVVLLVVSLIGGFLPLKVSQQSLVAMHIAYAFAGGILVAVALVHMLADASGDLEDWGKDISKALGGDPDDGFPLGNALFVIGFLIIAGVETLLHHKLGNSFHHGEQANTKNGHNADAEQPLAQDAGVDGPGSNTAGWATLIGLSIHSVVEGIAAGAGNDMGAVTFILLAIACHKGFAAFALASVNMPLWRGKAKGIWVAIVLWFAISGSGGILVGMAVSADVEGAATAAITALAAGSLLSVGVSEMLVPALSDGAYIGVKLFAATFAMLGMSLLAVWA